MTSTTENAADRSAETRDALRNAALEVFAAEGFHASVRQIAQAAGVSHGLVRHHFGSREGLRTAVDEWVIAELTAAFEIDTGRFDGATPGDLHGVIHAERRDRIVAFASDEPVIAAYLGRLVVDDPIAAQPLFDTMASRLRDELALLHSVGAAREPDDIDVIAAQIILLELGAVALRPLIERNLGMSLTSRDGAARWADSAFDLLTNGVYRSAE